MSHQQQVASKLNYDLQFFSQHCLKISTKSGNLVPFEFNKAQQFIQQRLDLQLKTNGRVRALLLKGRQQGCSTYTGARFFHRSIMTPNRNTFILSHDSQTTDKLFDMVDRFYKHLPTPMQPKCETKNRRKLVFEGLASTYSVGTAGNAEVGRGGTLQQFHGSEVGFWQNTDNLDTGLLQSVADLPGTEIILESTANGASGYYYEKCLIAMEGKGDYELIFIPWYWQLEYRKAPPPDFHPTEEEQELQRLYQLDDSQIYWRRKKIEDFRGKVWKFKQEYPCITGDMRVSTNRGMIRLDEVREGDRTPQGDVTKFIPKGKKKVYEVVTKNNYKLKGTEDHLVQTSRGEFVPLKELKGEKVQLSPVIFSETYRTVPFDYLPCISSEIEIDERWGRFLGFFMGDGSLYGNTVSVVFDEKDRNTIELVKDDLEKLIGRPPAERRVGMHGVEVRISDKAFKEVLVQLGVTKKHQYKRGGHISIEHKRKVYVPEIIFRSPKTVVKEFLKGAFDSDGFVGKKCATVKFFSKEEIFSRGIQILLLGFGITSRFNKVVKHKKEYSYTGNELVLNAKSARKFSEKIGFVSKRKIKRSKERPLQVGLKPQDIKLEDEVIQIKYIGEEEVFDLIVPQTNTFNANGIVVHNCSPMEAFQTSGEGYFRPMDISRAMKTTPPIDHGSPLVIGVDPAGGGKDSISIARRRGHHLYNTEEIDDPVSKDPMAIVGKLVHTINTEKPDMMFVDMGYGGGIVSRLHELGYRNVQGVYFAESPMDKDTYSNKRAEMHDLFRIWLSEIGSSIPDELKLQKQLAVIPQEKMSSNGKQLMVSKDEIKKLNNGESPNLLDSIILTFAFPVRKGNHNRTMSKPTYPQAIRNQQQRSPLLTMRPRNRQNGTMPMMANIIEGGL